VTFIEVLSFLSRPVSHSVRLFANMLAGHITLKVFGGFVTMLGALGFLGWLGAIIPLGLTVALTALELLVNYWWPSCRPTSSPSSLASISVRRSTRATDARSSSLEKELSSWILKPQK